MLPLALLACKGGGNILNITGQAMGTNYTIVAIDHAKVLENKDVELAIKAAISGINQSLSNWDAGSEISRFNAAHNTDPIKVSKEFATIVAHAQKVHQASERQFDISLGPLIETWGFGAQGTKLSAPSEAAIELAMAKSGDLANLKVSSNALQKNNSESELFLSGIGKGFGVDQIAQALQSLGVKDYLVEIGGDLVTSGRNGEGMAWQIGIETPTMATRDVQAVIPVSNLAVATSGDYRNYFEQDGRRYSHILDSQTGRPVTHNTASATVIAENAMMADAWSTAMLVLGRERGLEIAERNGVAVMFLDREEGGSRSKVITRKSSQYKELTA